MIAPIVACMGGFCRSRDRCAHHHSPSRTVVERLCDRGTEEPEPLSELKRWEGWLAGATPEQAERFRRLQAQRNVVVPDEQLPPALRGGNLEVF